MAEDIIAADTTCKGSLHQLHCFNPAPSGVYDSAAMAVAVSAYARYLTDECGTIHLDGLPADSEVGSRLMQLENLFVPLHLDIQHFEEKRLAVGAVLHTHP